MTTQNSQQKDVIHLDSENRDRQVLVTPADKDRFVITCEQAIQACQHKISTAVWYEELDLMLQHIRKWAGDQSGRVNACYVACREARVVIFIVPESGKFDFELAESIAELDLDIARNHVAIQSELLQVPGPDPSRLVEFVDPEQALSIYAKPA